MSELIKYDDYITEKKGRELYQNNINYRNLSTVMEHPEFRNFYNTYLKRWFEAKTMMMFMKVYEAIETQLDVEPTPYQKIAILHAIMTDNTIRRRIFKCMSNWSENDLLTDSRSSDTIRKYICSNTDPKC